MAFNQFRINFEFKGKLEVLKDGTDSKGNEVKGSVRDNGKGFTKLVLKGKSEKQGDFYLEANGFQAPVKFTLNEVDSKGVNKTYEFNGGKLKYDTSEIKDLWKSTFKLKKGETEQVFYHSKDFVNALIKTLPNIEKQKNVSYLIKGVVDRSPYNGNMIDKYVFNYVEILPKSDEDYLKVIEVFGYKKEELKGISLTPYELISLNTKDKGRKEFFYKSSKRLKLDNKWLLGGSMDGIPLNENLVIISYIKDIGKYDIGKIKVHYKPVVNITKEEKTDYKADLESLPPEYKISYKMLIDRGLEEQAKNMIQKVTGAIRLSEGGGFREYYIDEFEYSTDFSLNISEVVSKADFLETNISKITMALSKENKNKLLLSTIEINQDTTLVDVNSEEESNIFDESYDTSFESALNDSDETLSETDGFNEFVDEEEAKKEAEEKAERDKLGEEGFNELYPEGDKEEEPVEEEPSETEEESNEEDEVDLFSEYFG